MKRLDRIKSAGFKVLGRFGNKWYCVEKDGETGIILWQSAYKVHFFWNDFEGSASGNSPETCRDGSIGDVLGTDGEVRSYENMLRNAPEKYLSISDGLYRTSSYLF